MQDLIAKKTTLDGKVTNFIAGTNVGDLDDKKRSLNYLGWISQKTDLVQQEKTFSIPERLDKYIDRGSVVWVEFGFNLGREFGGRHPALIWRRTGESVFVIPLSSQIPTEIKSHHVKIEKVWGFANKERWCNVLKMQNVSVMRIDTTAAIGNVKGPVLDAVSRALVATSPY